MQTDPLPTIATHDVPSGVAGWAAAALALALAALAARAMARLRGTTLAAPAAWGVAAAVVVAAVEAALAWRPDAGGSLAASMARYAAAAGTFCPVMAVLGAKRPQDRGWQWIVLSLWVVLLVPAAQAWASRAGGELTLSMAWTAFLGVLIAAGLLNYLPTRWAPTAVAYAFTQLQWLFGSTAGGRELEAACVAVLVVVAAWQTRALHPAARVTPATPLDAFTLRWLAFRNAWGAFWGLRVLHRINESAELSGWPVRLEWSGFAENADAATTKREATAEAQIKQAMDSTLRRFERTTPSAATSTNAP